ncbi:sensor domain-containing diguanylate cyclase [Anaerostipes sp.]|uniref:sensor domain-containing diguanylate cyclase n=1 Tax=Anaerostipes sp. TaxID=1872530 RepID=UPI0025C2ACCC|nr:diguanylate cyclase [Anaerostipes sp.]MBS7008769.1 diguanylate cyclase [Anaerostipes sp.]
MKSIQTKFVLLILSSVMLCSLVIGGGAIRSTKGVIDDFSVRFMNLQCREGAEKFNSQLERTEQAVNTLSVFALDELKSVKKLKTDDAYVKAYTKHLEEVVVNAANNTEGALAVYVRFNPEFTKPDSGLFWSKTTTNGNFQRLKPTNFSNYSPTDVEHVGWYYLPVQNGKPMWMEPYLNQNINVRMISYVVPLYKEDEVIGVVGMDIDFGIFEKLADDVRVYDTGYAFLSSEDGRIMHHPKYSLNTKLVDVNKEFQPLVQELKSETSASSLFTYTLGGKTKKIAYRTLDNGMKLAITAPVSEINAERNGLIIRSLILLAVISLLFVIITVVFTKRIVRPLKELNEAARKIAAGDLTITLTQQSKDEVGMLTDSFQQTVNQLQKYISYINGLAYRDALTGVKNHTAYKEVENRLEEQMRIGEPRFALVVMDINGLKIVNDRYGHDFGDMLIMDACKYICKIFKHCPVYRIGGDEFVVILENEKCDRYAQFMEEFASGMEEYNRTAQPDNQISIAAGVAVYNSQSDLVFANVFKRADDAMYQNKIDMKAKQQDTAADGDNTLK